MEHLRNKKISVVRYFKGLLVLLTLATHEHHAVAQADAPVQAPRSGESLMRQGLIFLNTNQCETAILLFDRVYWTDPKYFNDALFHIIYCQHQLQQYSKVLSNLQYLNRNKLSPSKLDILNRMIQSSPYQLRTTWTSISGTAGGLSFPGSRYNGSGYFLGGAASVIFPTQKITFSYDRVVFSRIEDTPISQNQYSLFYGAILNDHWAIQTHLGFLDSSDLNSRDAKAFGIYLKYFNTTRFYLSNESFLTPYPNYNSHALWVLQSSLGLGFSLKQSNSDGLYLDLKGTLIRPSQFGGSLETFSNQNYLSGSGGLRYYHLNWSATASFTLGNQIFAVRNGGQTIVNTPWVRTASAQASVGYSFSPSFSLTLMMSGDLIEEPQGQTSSAASGLSMGFTF